MMEAMMDLKNLITETRNEETMNLDEMTPSEIIRVMNREDERTIAAVRQASPQIEQTIRWTTEALKKDGRIIYLGAGTSGRLGVLDAAECQPTFGVPDGVVVGLIAGGAEALTQAKECVEDHEEAGRKDLEKIGLRREDVVIGLAASGRTPYVIGGVRYANELGCHTVSVCCNPDTPLSRAADCAIELIVGPEVLTGSTRLKGGTAEKMVLNMISTASMIGIGKVYQNLMVDVRQTNEKLVTRAENIVMDAALCSRDTARESLREAGGEAKLAITMLLLNCDIDTARRALADADGRVRAAVATRSGSGGRSQQEG